jgi:hypothetical protein
MLRGMPLSRIQEMLPGSGSDIGAAPAEREPDYAASSLMCRITSFTACCALP